MKRITLFFALSIASSVHAAGPLFSHKDKITQREFENVYQDIRSANSRMGVVDGSDALTGEIGEYGSSVTANATLYPTSDTWGDLISISLAPGDWILTGAIDTAANGATMADDNNVAISSTSGNSSAGLKVGDNYLSVPNATASLDGAQTIAGLRANVITTTTYYLKYRAKYSVATPKATGKISKLRIR